MARCVQGRKLAHQKKTYDENSSLLSESFSEDESNTSMKAELLRPTPSPSIIAALTFQSTMNVLYYMLLAMHSVVFDQLIPVFLSYPIQDSLEQRLPFKFAGGFGLSSAEVGAIFSIYGIVSMLLQVKYLGFEHVLTRDNY